MANNLKANPWTLDTVGTVWNSRVYIRNIEFVGYTVATDAIVLKDRLGNNVWDARGSTSFDTVRSGTLGWIDGLRLDSITGGSAGLVKVYIK
jgi:hypothetical protein